MKIIIIEHWIDAIIGAIVVMAVAGFALFQIGVHLGAYL